MKLSLLIIQVVVKVLLYIFKLKSNRQFSIIITTTFWAAILNFIVTVTEIKIFFGVFLGFLLKKRKYKCKSIFWFYL